MENLLTFICDGLDKIYDFPSKFLRYDLGPYCSSALINDLKKANFY